MFMLMTLEIYLLVNYQSENECNKVPPGEKKSPAVFLSHVLLKYTGASGPWLGKQKLGYTCWKL